MALMQARVAAQGDSGTLGVVRSALIGAALRATFGHVRTPTAGSTHRPTRRVCANVGAPDANRRLLGGGPGPWLGCDLIFRNRHADRSALPVGRAVGLRLPAGGLLARGRIGTGRRRAEPRTVYSSACEACGEASGAGSHRTWQSTRREDGFAPGCLPETLPTALGARPGRRREVTAGA
jgi:hypothetical protein